MQNLKEELVQWLEAYASAKSSGNPTLIKFAAGNLSTFIEGIELTKIPGGPTKQSETIAEVTELPED